MSERWKLHFQVYVFKPASSSWTTLSATGPAPKPRHGHLLLAWASEDASEGGVRQERLFVHGGMAGADIFDDLFCLDLVSGAASRWHQLQASGPCARAAHGGAILKDRLFIFGGLGKDGALDDMWSFDIGERKDLETRRRLVACAYVTLCNPKQVIGRYNARGY